MQLKELVIWHNQDNFEWKGTLPGQYGGKLTFDGKRGEVTILLNPAQISVIMNVCADELLAVTTQVATIMKGSIINGITKNTSNLIGVESNLGRDEGVPF